MSRKPKDAVWISRETAEIALTELDHILDYADDERETGGERAAIDDLYHALDDDGPRTTVASSGEFDTVAITGVSKGAIVIDYGRTPPRVVITADDGEMPTDIIELPADEDLGGTHTRENGANSERVAVDAPDAGGVD
jgi:hypothetical protein